ncbi:hypothetical protein GYMLUDRAFT_958900 [Collybiopsis luxurians FD-317 M1]|nr:hypothetical protein GYMLUDRAFT_958900 [Collybiopsis luxurians FD-317 M1]
MLGLDSGARGALSAMVNDDVALPSSGVELAPHPDSSSSLGLAPSQQYRCSFATQSSENPHHETQNQKSTPVANVGIGLDNHNVLATPSVSSGSYSSCAHQTLLGQSRPTTSAEKATNTNLNSRYANVSAPEAGASSLALLRAGLLESFDALLILVSNRRPVPSSPLLSATTLDLDINSSGANLPQMNAVGIQSGEIKDTAGRKNDNGDTSSMLASRGNPNKVRAMLENAKLSSTELVNCQQGGTVEENSSEVEHGNINLSSGPVEGGRGTRSSESDRQGNTASCQTLSTVSSTGPKTTTSRSPDVFLDRRRNTLMLSNARSEEAMDEVEYEMVLGVIERYWECTVGLELTQIPAMKLGGEGPSC